MNINGNFQRDKYEFILDIFVKYKLSTDTEMFGIEHKCVFINTIGTRLIPIQEYSSLAGSWYVKIKKATFVVFFVHKEFFH